MAIQTVKTGECRTSSSVTLSCLRRAQKLSNSALHGESTIVKKKLCERRERREICCSSCCCRRRKIFFLIVNIRFWRLLSFNRVIYYSQCLEVIQQTEILAEFLRDRASSCSTLWKVSEMLVGEDKLGGWDRLCVCPCPSILLSL